jgi:capsular polysaccharide biosynthesis protein
MRRDGRLPVLAGTVVGLAVAVVVTVLQASTYRADASIALVRQGQPPGDDPALAQAAVAAADLFHGRAVADPAIANLRLDESADELLERVTVDTEAESSLVRISVEARSRDEARRTAQELTELATVRFNDRFGPTTVASVWEPARAEENRVSPQPARNLALGALAGALLGQLLALLLRRSRRPAVSAPRATRRWPTEPEAEPTAEREPAVEPAREVEPPPLPEPQPESAGSFVHPTPGTWTVADVNRLLVEQGQAFPERLDELSFYLESFRGVAGSDGRLPVGVEVVIEDVFADLIASARSAERRDRQLSAEPS